MCDQTEVSYSPGDVVWVKLGPVWWPGQVQDYDKLPEEITSDLRKKPIAVVKFFQEDTFEYVKNLNQIYQYNCRKKEEFIKKGLDMVRSSNSRDVPSNMKMFPNDIVMAEHLTGGDPNILDNKAFAPEQKSNYSDLFGTKKSSGKKAKMESLKKERDGWKSRKHSISPMRNGRRSLPTLPSTIPRPITHPRFITKALEGRSDHEVRIRCQLSSPPEEDPDNPPIEKKYKCHLCEFQSARLNVIVLHNKSHSASFIEAQNAYKARFKSKEREIISPTLNLIIEQTPTTVTSRGRVKSLPKKLLDYTDEPPVKKEKTYSKNIAKEEASNSQTQISTEKSSTKSPKKNKDNSEKTSIKRPLFGKRKTAKEKAELAAKQKQENEAMKETLLKDWDDDDVNQEEVELELLKQALESTTTSTSSEFEDDNNTSIDSDISTEVSDSSHGNVKEEVIVSNSKKIETESDIKTKVFEFDDSEDSLPVNINFRLKSQREKFTDDKFKKPKPPKPLIRLSSKPKLPVTLLPAATEKKEEDKDIVEFNEAFNALLEETVVPVLPEIPKPVLSLNSSLGNISDQTSDISSSTDLVKVHDNIEHLDDQMNKDVTDHPMASDSEIINNDLKMECTSSDSEEIKLSESIIVDVTKETEFEEKHQKNFDEVSANNPRAETNSDFSSGVATTTTDDSKFSEHELSPIDEDLRLREDATEISSTCDVTKTFNEKSEFKVPVKDEIFEEENVSHETKNEFISERPVSDIINVTDEHFNLDADRSKHDISIKCDSSEYQEIKSNTCLTEIEQIKEALKDNITELLPGHSGPIAVTETESEIPPGNQFEHDNLNSFSIHPKDFAHALETSCVKSVDENKEKEECPTREGTVLPQIEQNVTIKEEVTQQTSIENEQNIAKHDIDSIKQEEVPTENMMNVQLLLPVSTASNTNSIEINTQQSQSDETMETIVPQLEIPENSKMDNQNISQNLQDMELDINSMPVIIGGEDFIQPEQTKQNLVPVQPKYSESIVISPKSNISSPNKNESVIMHLGEPSTSNQNLQSLIAIPSKNERSGGRGVKSQKTTSKAIKLSASALKNLGTLQKGGSNQQVLILKTSVGQDKLDKGAISKNKGPLNMFQHGDKILIVNNPQMSGQNKIKLNPQQQQLLSGGKLTPGTRVFTSKVVATTTSQCSASPSKTSTSRTSSKPTQKLVISKGGMISNSSKSVIINNSTGKYMATVPGSHTITTSKGQTLITHNLLNTKGGLILPSSSQSISSTGKTTTLITSQALATSKGMILAPISGKSGTILSGNQKLRIVSSKAPLSRTRLVVQKPQGKLTIDPQNKGQQLKLISGLRGTSSGNTILIQTSQGIIAKSISSSTTTTATSQPTIRATGVGRTVMTTIPTQTKIRVTTTSAQQPQLLHHSPVVQQNQPLPQTKFVQQGQRVQQSQVVQPSPTVKKVAVQKIRQSPNILQKSQRKSTPRAPKSTGNRLINPTVSVSEPIILSTTSSLPVISQPTLVQGQVPPSTDSLVYLTVDEGGNYRPLDNKSLITFEGNASETPRQIFIPSDTRPQDIGNIFLAIDETGNIINLTHPTSSTTFPTENTAPSQDILAKALANTQVLQQETIVPDMDVSAALSSSMDSTVLASSSFSEQAQYPAPSLSHSVLETSLTLNQPIMTPLEVPSAVSPNLGQISSLSSNYISSNLLTHKQKHIRPSMPLLSEESLANQARGEAVFLLDSSNNIIPATSGSQISFHLALDENNVIMSSGSSGAVLPPTYQVVSGDLLTPQLVTTREMHSLRKMDDVKSESAEIQKNCQMASGENIVFNILPTTEQTTSEICQTTSHSIILREALEAPQISLKSEPFLNSVEMPPSDPSAVCNQVKENPFDSKFEQECTVMEDSGLVDNNPEEFNDGEPSKTQNDPLIMEGQVTKHSLKRSLGEEHTVTSSSDLEGNSKRIRLDER